MIQTIPDRLDLILLAAESPPLAEALRVLSAFVRFS